jgi:hypothetical protein
MIGFTGRHDYKYNYCNSSHIDRILDNESLTVFLLVLGLVSSLLYSVRLTALSYDSLLQSQSHIATDGQSVSQSVLVSSLIWGS